MACFSISSRIYLWSLLCYYCVLALCLPSKFFLSAGFKLCIIRALWLGAIIIEIDCLCWPDGFCAVLESLFMICCVMRRGDCEPYLLCPLFSVFFGDCEKSLVDRRKWLSRSSRSAKRPSERCLGIESLSAWYRWAACSIWRPFRSLGERMLTWPATKWSFRGLIPLRALAWRDLCS